MHDDRKILSKGGDKLVGDIKEIIHHARQEVYKNINSTMVRAYWLIGRRVVLDEQLGQERASYGQELIKNLAQELSAEFGKGFDAREIRKIRQFYLTFPIRDSLSPELEKEKSFIIKWDSLSPELNSEIYELLFSRLSWTHVRHLMRVTDPQAREYYIRESVANNWSTRTLDRNIATQYYQRLLASQVKEPVVEEMKKQAQGGQNEKFDFIKNPSVLEFLNLPRENSLTESNIESAIIDNLHHFLLELGKGFAFVERQKLIRTESRDYFIDLVFYNYILKCFVLIDLKTERITHQDVGQMDMYVRMYDETLKLKDDNPTVGIVLCSETDQDIARYSILKGNEQIFASKYKLYLPSEEELAAEIEREKEVIRLQLEERKNEK
jgi:predicted nuclease of restriction endonuclease-like (RecB) superfamily